MIAIEETTIHLTRGDATGDTYNKLAFNFPIFNFGTKQEENYKFKPDDKITFVVMNKKGYTTEEILRKDYTLRDLGYVTETEIAELPLTAEETKKFPLSNKAQTFWYDLILNDSTTILGFDNEGAKRIIVYPEAEEV
jgi:hypothetical protein